MPGVLNKVLTPDRIEFESAPENLIAITFSSIEMKSN